MAVLNLRPLTYTLDRKKNFVTVHFEGTLDLTYVRKTMRQWGLPWFRITLLARLVQNINTNRRALASGSIPLALPMGSLTEDSWEALPLEFLVSEEFDRMLEMETRRKWANLLARAKQLKRSAAVKDVIQTPWKPKHILEDYINAKQ